MKDNSTPWDFVKQQNDSKCPLTLDQQGSSYHVNHQKNNHFFLNWFYQRILVSLKQTVGADPSEKEIIASWSSKTLLASSGQVMLK